MIAPRSMLDDRWAFDFIVILVFFVLTLAMLTDVPAVFA